MQTNLPNLTNAQDQQAVSGSGSNKSTKNHFDFLMGIKDDSVEARFSSVLSGLKSKLGAFDQSNGKNTFGAAIQDMQAASRKQQDELREQDRIKEDEEEERKKHERRLKELSDEERRAELQAETEELQLMARLDVQAQLSGSAVDSGSSVSSDSSTGRAVRPSDILASAFAGRTTSGSFTGSNSGLASGADSGSMISGSASSGQGSGSGSGSFTGGAPVTGYGLDEQSNGARAARAMMNLSGTSTDFEIKGNLDIINEHNLSTISDDSGSAVEDSSSKISSYNNKELRQNLDSLARNANVSKLSLQMSNPAAVRDAEALANLPTSSNNLNSITASREAQNNLLNTINATSTEDETSMVLASGRSNGNAVGGTGVAAGAVGGGAVSSANVAGTGAVGVSAGSGSTGLSGQVNAIGVEDNGASQQFSRAASHGLNEGNTAEKLSADKQGKTAAHDGAARTERSAALDQRTAANQASLSHGSEGEETGDTSISQSKARDALLRLVGQSTDRGSAQISRAMAETMVRSDIRQDQMLMPDASDEMMQALTSLKQGSMGLGMSGAGMTSGAGLAVSGDGAYGFTGAVSGGAATSVLSITDAVRAVGSSYENSSLYNSMFGSSSSEGVDGVATLTGAHVNATSTDNDSEGAEEGSGNAGGFNAQNGAVTADAARAENADKSGQQPQQSFNFSGDPTSDAAMLHEHVMQMAARNMKQLAVELNPDNLGKMKIEIALSDDNEALSVSIQAVRPQTRELLEQALPKLRDILAQQNIETDAAVTAINEDNGENGKGGAGANSGEQSSGKDGSQDNRPSLADITRSSARKRGHLKVADASLDSASAQLTARSQTLSALK